MKTNKSPKDFLHYNPIYKSYSFIREATKWELLSQYGFAFGLLCLTFISLGILKNPALGMACACATIATSVMTFLSISKKRHTILPETVFSSPAFIVSNAGIILRGNQAAAELMVKSGSDFQTLLEQDGLEEGAAFRLLQENKTNILKHGNILYTSRPLEEDKTTFLITRMQRGENLSHIYNKFAEHSGSVTTQPSPDNPLNDIKKKLTEWVEKDEDLKDFMSKDNQKLIKNLSSHFGEDISQLISFIDIHTGENIDLNSSIYGQGDNKFVGFFSKKVSYLSAYQEIVATLYEPATLLDKDGKVLAASYNFIKEFGDGEGLRDSFSDYFEKEGSQILQLLYKKPSMEFDIKLKQGDIELIRTFSAVALHDEFYIVQITQSREHLLDTIKEEVFQQLKHLCVEENDPEDKQDEKPQNAEPTPAMMDDKFYQIQKMQAVGQLAGGVAHDFNNLLTAILGHTELLLERMTPLDHAFSDLKQIEHNAHRAGKLVQQLLAFSRQQTLKPNLVNLTDILPDMNELFRRLLGENIIIDTYYGPNLSPVKIDVTQLEQILLNLAVNARDAMPSGGKFSIRTMNISPEESIENSYDIMPQGEYVAIYVSDTGCGMPKEIAAKVFEPFFTTKDIGKGTGLGLSTVYGIVKQSNGFIFLESVEGKGTCFKIYLPAQKEEEITVEKSEIKVQAPQEIPEETKTEAPHTKTILIAEDEHSVREFIVRTLSMKGYNILEADCGEEALELFEKNKDTINLILSDVMMPGMDGPTWVKKAKEHSEKISVIFMSGYAEDSFRNDPTLEKEGIYAKFLAKPFTLKQLTQTVKDNI